jgi:hypothetical protein
MSWARSCGRWGSRVFVSRRPQRHGSATGWAGVAVRIGTLVRTGAVVILAAAAQAAHADLASERLADIDRLIAKGTANSLATAALLKQFGAESDSGAYDLISRAVQLAPDRRDLAWLAVRLCASSSDCNDAVPEKHLHDIDPTNGVGFIGPLVRAQRKNDIAGIDAALTALGKSDKFYVYFDPLIAATTPELVVARHPGGIPFTKKEDARATMDMAGTIAASVLPPTQSFSYSCKGLALEQVAGRLNLCRRATKVMTHADTFLVEGLGLSYQQQLWPLDSPEGRATTAQRRVFQYRMEEYNHIDISTSKVEEYPTDALAAFRTHDREQDVALFYFAKAGTSKDPPPNWKSQLPPRVPAAFSSSQPLSRRPPPNPPPLNTGG